MESESIHGLSVVSHVLRCNLNASVYPFWSDVVIPCDLLCRELLNEVFDITTAFPEASSIWGTRGRKDKVLIFVGAEWRTAVQTKLFYMRFWGIIRWICLAIGWGFLEWESMESSLWFCWRMFLRFLGARETAVCNCCPHHRTQEMFLFFSISYITLYVSASETKLDLHHGKCITKGKSPPEGTHSLNGLSWA